jgi:hypothetical protein
MGNRPLERKERDGKWKWEIRNGGDSHHDRFQKAMEWLANTGQGLQDDGNEGSIKKYLNNICPYYRDLGEIMMDKPSIYANITSDNLELQPSRHLWSVSLSSCTYVSRDIHEAATRWRPQ